ncbi:hypothetical protein [Methylobacterium thuringiense]|uniref:Uncharacterized protein n=1 Tax=Methylobacterium thuringiense TaxID=1003091 RepID=A0ABQ4TU38_9HYPH|nr:hypothetical protein [Methylobacterium thuringiense]GJE57405.1 hypothetical protein EKPJFOCH_3919 [Methylobacterium thuringiense]
MRVILLMLAVANFRWGQAAIQRANLLTAQRDDAWAEAERRMALAESLMNRGRILPR